MHKYIYIYISIYICMYVCIAYYKKLRVIIISALKERGSKQNMIKTL